MKNSYKILLVSQLSDKQMNLLSLMQTLKVYNLPRFFFTLANWIYYADVINCNGCSFRRTR